MNIIMKNLLLVITTLLISGCLGMPKAVTPVTDFDINNYLGKWYEVARLDHSFERGLSKVTAEYRLKDDGGVQVINRGFSIDDNAWQEAEGKAYFVNESSEGYLKVSFFGPFYGSYVIFALDQEDYKYAFISGPNTEYLWFLSRTPTVPETLKNTFISMAQARGFNTENLIFVEHE